MLNSLKRNCTALALASLAILATAWATTVQRIAFERRAAIAEAVRTHDNLALALEQHTRRTVAAVDQTLRFLRHEHGERPSVDIPRLIARDGLDASMLSAVLLVDAQGRVTSSSAGVEGADLSAIDTFVAHRDDASPRLRIGTPRKGVISGSYTVPLSRRLSLADGAFDGLVSAGLNVEYLSAFYDLVDLGPGGLVLLARLDGTLLARRTLQSSTAGSAMGGTTLMRLAAAADAGSYESRGRLDGVTRLMSYRALRDLGLVVAVGNSADAVLGEANRRRGWYLGGASAATLLTLLFAAGLIAALRRQKAAMDAAVAGERRYRATFEQAAIGIVHAGLDGRLVKVNPKFIALLGSTERELLGRRYAELTHPEDAPLSLERAAALLADPDVTQPSYEKRYLRRDGATVWAAVTLSLVRDAEGRPAYFIALVQDITARRLAEARLARQAHHDALTDLPNRALLFDRMAQALTQARRKHWTAGVLYVNLDRFKAVNDSLGHERGDRLLREAAARLCAAVRGGDTVARVGGDEFVVALPEIAAPEDAARVAQKVIDAMARPFLLDGEEVFVSASVGIATFPADGADVPTMMKNADAAMLRAKQTGGAGYQFYAASMNRHAAERLRLEADLRRALERDEFRLVFQPRARIGDRRAVGFEALLRWQRAGNGMVPPAEFVPLLEDSGLIVPVGEWVIRAACAQLAAWRDAGLRPLPVAVNVAAKQFLHGDLCEVLERALREHRVDAGLIEIEITESDAMQDAARATALLEKMRGRGIRVAIDDFGTGYSSLGYLKRFPVDLLKLDRSFVSGLPGDADDVSIARAVIAMAHSLNLKVVAEGVETEAQRDFLARNGCDEMQGYLLSRPLPPAECGAWLERQAQAAAA